MALRAERYRATKAQTIADAATRMAFEEVSQLLEQLARDAETRVSSLPTDTFPSGAVVFWIGDESTIPAGWSRCTSLDGRFPRGMTGTTGSGTTGGNVNHFHVAVDTMGTPNSLVGVAAGSSYNVGSGTHKHSLDVDVQNADHLPPYLDGIWIQKD